MVKLTTSECRKRARKYEAECKWTKALEWYDKAIRAYPRPVGALAELDLNNLKAAKQEIALFIKRIKKDVK